MIRTIKKVKWVFILTVLINFMGGGIVNAYYGIMELLPINKLIEDSDLVLIGSPIHFSRDKTEQYWITTVEVIDILKGNLSKRAGGGKNEHEKIFVLEKIPFNDLSAVLTPQGKNLLFLKATNLDPAIIDKLKLDISRTYTVSHGWRGVFTIFNPRSEEYRKKLRKQGIEDPRPPQEIYLNRQYGIKEIDEYVKAVRDLCKVMNLKDKKQRKKELMQLLKKKSKVYEESAVAELEKLGVHVKEVAGEYQVISEEERSKRSK